MMESLKKHVRQKDRIEWKEKQRVNPHSMPRKTRKNVSWYVQLTSFCVTSLHVNWKMSQFEHVIPEIMSLQISLVS